MSSCQSCGEFYPDNLVHVCAKMELVLSDAIKTMIAEAVKIARSEDRKWFIERLGENSCSHYSEHKGRGWCFCPHCGKGLK